MKSVLLFVAAASAISLSGVPGTVTPENKPLSWDPNTLPACPPHPRTLLDDGETQAVKYPFVGASCKMQVGSTTLYMQLPQH